MLDFPGCLLVVSHDRYFMDKIVDHLLVFEGEGTITDFPGNYSDYRAYDASKAPEPKKNEPKPTEQKSSWKENQSSGGLSYSEQKEFKRLEKDIEKLEKDKAKLQEEFLNDLSPEDIEKKSKRLGEINDAITEKEERWLELSMTAEG